MPPLFACFQTPRVAAPVTVKGVVGDRVLTLPQPSRVAADQLLNDNGALCAAFAHLELEGETLEVASKADGVILFKARRLSTGEAWTDALDRKREAAEAAAKAFEAQTEKLLEEVQGLKKMMAAEAKQTAARFATMAAEARQTAERFAMQEKMLAEEGKQMAERVEVQEKKLAAFAAQTAEERRALDEKIADNVVRLRILASTGEAIALRLMCDLTASVVKEAAFCQWASQEKKISRGIQQLSKANSAKATSAPSTSAPSSSDSSDPPPPATTGQQDPTAATPTGARASSKEKKDAQADAFARWLGAQSGAVEVTFPSVGKKVLSQQALTTVATAPSLSHVISGACAPDGAHSAPLVAIAYVLVSKETAGKFEGIQEHLGGLKEVFAAMFDKEAEEVLADYKSQSKGLHFRAS